MGKNKRGPETNIALVASKQNEFNKKIKPSVEKVTGTSTDPKQPAHPKDTVKLKKKMGKNKRGPGAIIALDASKQKEFSKKVMKVKKLKPPVTEDASLSGVIYISHLPWGFEEQPLREYFTQFGKIVQLRVSRSKKTGNPRGYAYIQFSNNEVAKIAADTMNNYLMFGKLIKCRQLLKPHPKTFKHANKRFSKPKNVEAAIMKRNEKKSEEAIFKSQSKMLKKLDKLRNKLAQQGIEYELYDPLLEEARKALKTKAELRKAKMLEKAKLLEKVGADDDKGDSDDNEEGGDSDSSDKEGDESLPLKLKKNKENIMEAEKLVSGKNKKERLSLIPSQVDTPKGKMSVLIEDSSEDEISFKTPPMSVKSSNLDASLNISVKKTPKLSKKSPPKRKLEPETNSSKSTEVVDTPTDKIPAKKAKLLSKSAQKAKVPKEAKDLKVPKSAGKMGTFKADRKKKEDKSTPKVNLKKKLEIDTPSISENISMTPSGKKKFKSNKESLVTDQSMNGTPAKSGQKTPKAKKESPVVAQSGKKTPAQSAKTPAKSGQKTPKGKKESPVVAQSGKKTPAQSAKTPAKSGQKTPKGKKESPVVAQSGKKTPAKLTKTPAKSEPKTPKGKKESPVVAPSGKKTPAQSAKTPAKSEPKTPKSAKKPAKSADTPAELGSETPAQSAKIPAKSADTPAKAGSKTPKSAKKLAKAVKTPAQSADTPVKHMNTPAKGGKKTPGKTGKNTPSKGKGIAKSPKSSRKTPAKN